MKTDKNFKLPKFVKRRMATIVNDAERHSYKRSMIDALVEGSRVVVQKDKRKGKSGETETD